MRISSVQMMSGYLKRLNDSYEEQTKLFEQSDGNSLHRPSDDSVKYSKYLRHQNTLTENLQYNDNVKRGVSWMQTADKALVNMTDLQQTIVEKTVLAATDTNNELNEVEISKEIYGYIQQIVALGNDKQGDRFLFSGQSDLTQPFILSLDESEWVDRGMTKTLDDTQKIFFNDADKDGNATQFLSLIGSNGEKYFLNTLTHNVYTEDFVKEGYKALMAVGQKHVEDKDAAYKLDGVDEFTVGSYFKATGEIRTQTTYAVNNAEYIIDHGTALTGADGTALKTGDTFTADSAVTVHTIDNKTKIIKAGETYTLGDDEYAVAGATLDALNPDAMLDFYYSKTTNYAAGDTVTDKIKADIKPGTTLYKTTVADENGVLETGTTVSKYLTPDASYKFDIPVTVVTESGSTVSYAAGDEVTFGKNDVVYAGKLRDNGIFKWGDYGVDDSSYAKHPTYAATYNASGTSVYASEKTKVTPGDTITVETAGNYKFNMPVTVLTESGTRHVYDAGTEISITDKDMIFAGVDYDHKDEFDAKYLWEADDANPNRITFSFETVKQPIVTYHGDNKRISMVKRNGLIDPTADTVNISGQDFFGTDIFDNVNSGNQINGQSSGAAGLNDLLTVYVKMRAGDSHWLSSDGITLSDAAHQTTVDAETTIAARQQVYEEVDEMLQYQNAIILQDINDVNATDVAKLATSLMAAQTIYNMSLSIGARILPPTLADYL